MPSDSDMIDTRYHYHFIHNIYANFFKDTLEYFTTYLHPRFEYKVVGTYDKAVEYLSKTEQYSRETDKPLLPAFILNPTGEFNIAEGMAGGKQLWRFPNLAPGMVKRLFEPIYQDPNVNIHVGFMRIKGEIELIMLLNSFYEYADLRMLFIQIFGGADRWIYPQWFDSFVILPDELINYTYTNSSTGETYSLNWDSAGAYQYLVRTTNRNELVVPCTIKPIYKLTSLGDGSTKYGGEKLADWRLTAGIEYEVEMPSFLILEADYLAENIELEIRYSSCYSAYSDFQPPIHRHLYNVSWDFGLDTTGTSEIDIPDEADVEYSGKATFKTRYFHIVTAGEAASETNVDISIPEQITERKLLIVNSYNGQLKYGDDYTIKDSGNTLEINVTNINLQEDMIIELYVYDLV